MFYDSDIYWTLWYASRQFFFCNQRIPGNNFVQCCTVSTYENVSQSPLMVAAVICSVSLIISCLLTAKHIIDYIMVAIVYRRVKVKVRIQQFIIKITTLLWEITCRMESQCYLPLGSSDFPAFTPAEAGTQFSYPRGMQGWVDLGGGYIPR